MSDAQRWELSLTDISPDPKNPRSTFGDLAELQASIEAYGVIQAVTVRSANADDKAAGVNTPWVLVEGERRWRAAAAAKLTHIPAVRYDLLKDDPTSVTLELSIIANMQRNELTPVDTARALQDILDTTKESVVVVSKRIGKSEAWVRRRLALLELPEQAQAAINDSLIPLDAAPALRAMVGKVPPDIIESVVREAIKRRLNAAGISNLVAPYLAADEHKKKAPKAQPLGAAPAKPSAPPKGGKPAEEKPALPTPTLSPTKPYHIAHSMNGNGQAVVIVTCADNGMRDAVIDAAKEAVEEYIAAQEEV
jgi:ParB family chromosome partitioning protein